jgi:glycosyltransferase involved in cell wall biosynthesis
MRLLVVANAMIPTVQLSLLTPLAKLIKNDECFVDFLTEQQLKEQFGKNIDSLEASAWIEERWRTADPTNVIFCRYSGPHAKAMLTLARSNGVPSVYCIDDDLLNVPLELGSHKYNFHNNLLRLQTVRYLLEGVDLVYCSNARLEQRLRENKIAARLHVGQIFCAGEIISPAELRTIRTIGYMGFDHAHDFEIALPGLIKVLHRFPDLHFELFGKIPKPEVLDKFGGRIVVLPVVPDYGEFLKALAARHWDVGICPLASTDFNRVKNVNKWIEYTAVGTAVVATKGMIYDECCADGCGLLAATEDEWFSSMETLISDSKLRFQLVSRAQSRLQQDYSLDGLRDQVMRVFHRAREIAERKRALQEK